MSAFNKVTFEAAFAASILALAGSEAITKKEMMVLSRTVLTAVHETGDIGYVNRLIYILTPVNRKVATEFFKEFTGFSHDGMFTTKNAKQYTKAKERAITFLEDPLNNIWTWADRNIEVVKKDFSLDQVTDAIKKFEKKAVNAGLTQKDVIKAVLAAGVELSTILELMTDVYHVDTEESKIVVVQD